MVFTSNHTGTNSTATTSEPHSLNNLELRTTNLSMVDEVDSKPDVSFLQNVLPRQEDEGLDHEGEVPQEWGLNVSEYRNLLGRTMMCLLQRIVHVQAQCMWLTGHVTAHVSSSALRTLLSRCSVADKVTSLCMQRGMSWNRPLRSTPLRDEEDQRHTRW